MEGLDTVEGPEDPVALIMAAGRDLVEGGPEVRDTAEATGGLHAVSMTIDTHVTRIRRS